LFELPHRFPSSAAVRAQLRHHERFLAATVEPLAHQLFAAAVVIFPGVVHEGDAGVERGMDEAYGFAH
jgi:hypothetical protein